jgi:hypothetical protein
MPTILADHGRFGLKGRAVLVTARLVSAKRRPICCPSINGSSVWRPLFPVEAQKEGASWVFFVRQNAIDDRASRFGLGLT